MFVEGAGHMSVMTVEYDLKSEQCVSRDQVELPKSQTHPMMAMHVCTNAHRNGTQLTRRFNHLILYMRALPLTLTL